MRLRKEPSSLSLPINRLGVKTEDSLICRDFDHRFVSNNRKKLASDSIMVYIYTKKL
jgi:hypothetical protein